MDSELTGQDGELGEGAAPDGGVVDRNYGIPWEPGQCRSCGAWFQKAGALTKHHRALTKHHRAVHSEIPLRFECGMCSRVFPGSHAALCHYSKCGGARVEELPNICDLCNRGYRTVSGLSQHRRHMHPEARIQERMMAVAHDDRLVEGEPSGVRRRRRLYWSLAQTKGSWEYTHP